MDNSEQKANRGDSAAGKDFPSTPDPTVKARDDSSNPNQKNVPAEVNRRAERTAGVMLPQDQFAGSRGQMKPVLSAQELIESSLRYKWTILGVFVMIAAPAIAAIWTQVAPMYQAKAEVRVRPIIPYLVFRTEDSGAIPLYDSYVKTQVSIIKSMTVLQRVLDQDKVKQTTWYTNPPGSLVQRLGGNPPDQIDRLQDALSAQPRGETEIIDVTFIARDAGDAKVILDTVLDQYMKYIEDKSDQNQDILYNQLVEQHDSLKNEISGLEDTIARIRQPLKTTTPEELVSVQRVRVDETQARLAEVQLTIDLLDRQIKQFETNDSNDTLAAEDVQRQRRYHEDAEWRKLDVSVQNLRHAIETSGLTDRHPDAIRAQKDLAFAEEMLRTREAQLDEQWSDLQADTAGQQETIAGDLRDQYDLVSLKRQLDDATYEKKFWEKELGGRTKDLEELFSTTQLLEKENSALLHKRELFDAVRRRLEQKRMERNVPGSIEKMTKEAAVPSKPYNDPRMEYTSMVLVIALGLGGGLAFLRDSRNKLIYGPKDMPYPMQVSLLGCIPDISGAKPSNGQAAHALIESARVIRSALLSRLGGQGCTTVLVTSAGAGTGKSSFTMILGKSLAQAGKRVLMIDADFAKMALTRHFDDLSNKSGFVQSLRRKSIYRRHIFQTKTPGLSLVPAGKRSDDDEVLEEIANGAFNACIGKLRQQYDMILLDSPPILPLADATILSSQVDGTIMVERELVSHRTDVISALARIGSAGGHLLGTVFVGSGSYPVYRYS